MIPDMVADVGNTRVKWAICESDGILGSPLSLPHDPAAWEEKRSQMLDRRFRWVVASVRPAVSDRLIEWLRGQGDEVTLLRHEHLPLSVNVDEPGKVGIDRLLNAVAVVSVLGQGEPAVLVDAGSAVTVDYMDEDHVFQGGTIFPGLDLMAEALHRYTALLPHVRMGSLIPDPPGKSTVSAIQAGILHAVAGGITAIAGHYQSLTPASTRPFLTGGDARLLAEALGWGEAEVWPEMTLTGILIAARGVG